MFTNSSALAATGASVRPRARTPDISRRRERSSIVSSHVQPAAVYSPYGNLCGVTMPHGTSRSTDPGSIIGRIEDPVLRPATGRRYFSRYDPLGADMNEYPLRPAPNAANDARPAWIGFLGGAVVLALAILIAVGNWHFLGYSASPLTASELTEIEALLDELGFPPGPVDGAIDEKSRNALRDFQVTAGLNVDGTPSPALLDELRAAKAELGGN